MKEKSIKLITRYWWILLIVSIGVGLFYWYQVRPALAIKTCHKEATRLAEAGGFFALSNKAASHCLFNNFDCKYQAFYEACLRGKGMDK